MGKQILIRKLVREELEKCEKLQMRLESEYKSLPKGSLIRRSNGSTGISVRQDGRQYQIVLPHEDEMIFQLKKKRYIKAGRASLAAWIDGCKYMLEKGGVYDPLGLEESLPEQYSGLEGMNIFPDGEINPADWMNSIEEESQFYPENLIHQTPGGVLMRSKSEVMIGTLLEHQKIPYKYEPEITCGSRKYSPDFEILHRRLNRLVYLEHFGMIDDPNYVTKNLEKLKDYARNGMVLGYNLFFTYETRDKPLTVQAISKVIDEILAMEV